MRRLHFTRRHIKQLADEGREMLPQTTHQMSTCKIRRSHNLCPEYYCTSHPSRRLEREVFKKNHKTYSLFRIKNSRLNIV